MGRLSRIEALLGSTIGAADEASIGALVAGGVREDADLDFKETLYGNTDSDKRELAGDLAAMANTRGGVLILGVQEANGAATSTTPVALSDPEELRMRQVVAANVQPFINFEIHRIPLQADPATGFYILEVQQSASAPHAVVVNTGLRYPQRDGASTRWLSESEVADAYRNRFVSAREQVKRVAAVRQEGETALPDPTDHVWLSLAIVPNSPGAMPISRQSVDDMRSFPRHVDCPSIIDSALRVYASDSRAGFRRIILTVGSADDGSPRGGLIHLHQDGSSFVAIRVGRAARDAQGEVTPEVLVNDEWLTQEVLSAVAVGAAHALTNAGASGDAAIEATLVTTRPMFLHHGRGFDASWNNIPVEDAPVGRHTIALDDVAGSIDGLLSAARLVLTDLVQGFGVPDSPQLPATGGVDIRYFRNGVHERVAQEAARLGFQVTAN